MESLCHNHLCFWGQSLVHSIFHRSSTVHLLHSLLLPSSFLSLNDFSIIDALDTDRPTNCLTRYTALTDSYHTTALQLKWTRIARDRYSFISHMTFVGTFLVSGRAISWAMSPNSVEAGRHVVYPVIGAVRSGQATQPPPLHAQLPRHYHQNKKE